MGIVRVLALGRVVEQLHLTSFHDIVAGEALEYLYRGLNLADCDKVSAGAIICRLRVRNLKLAFLFSTNGTGDIRRH